VQGDERDSENRGEDHREAHERGERDHRPPERPEHDEDRDAIIEVELVGEAAQHHDLEKDQPEPTREQEARELRLGLPAKRQVRAGSREQKEDGRADVRDPAREEERRRRLREIDGILAGDAEIVACVIERHDDHDHPAHDVDRLDAHARRGGGRTRRC
jgi:hypothetical protein